MRLFGRAHDHAVLVDPHTVGHVDDAEALVDEMRGVDQRRMIGIRGLDERAGGVGINVEGDGDDLESLRVELGA
jgi:hypothetical protein